MLIISKIFAPKFFLLKNLGIILFVFILLLYSYKRGIIKFENNISSPTQPKEYALEFSGTTISGWKKGEKLWEVKAEKILVSKDERFIEFYKISSGHFFKDKKITANFHCEFGRYDRIMNNLEISGNIKLKNKETLIETEKIIYTGQDKKLSTLSPVKFTMKEGYIVSQRVIAFPDLNEIELFENTGEFRIKELEKKI